MQEVKIRYTRAPSASKIPLRRAHPCDAGADLTASEGALVLPLSRSTIPTGLSMEIPEGYYGRIAPRSGLAHRHGIDVMAGVIDSTYRGEIKVVLYNSDRNEPFQVSPGDKIAQIIIERHYNFEFVEVEELDPTPRGSGGFGSTGI
jgi:dUTP pyrophosphatase